MESSDGNAPASPPPRRVLVAGASGYIGRVLVAELLRRGHSVTALCRPETLAGREVGGALAPAETLGLDLFDEPALAAASSERGIDAVFSCIATRGGGVADAWRVEHDANRTLLAAAQAAEVRHFVLLSAICVQKPRLAFQHAKLAFEQVLREAGITWSIVRPTAFFKSLAGQIARVRAGKPFLVFGDGLRTACKPIGEADCARFLAACLEDPAKHDAVLPVGGPGPALTPREQGALLFELLEREPRYRSVPVRLFDVAGAALGAGARVFPKLADKAEFARIGRYYATESMLLWDARRQAYDADATPEFGTETLRDFYTRVLVEGLGSQRLGDHALFDRKARS